MRGHRHHAPPARPPLPSPAPGAPPPRPAWNTNRNLVVTHPLLALLESCASFPRFLQLHALLTVSGLAAGRFPASRLLAFCALSTPPRVDHAAAILARAPAPGPNAYMLATMMRAFLRARLPRRALALFRRVVGDALPADARTLVFALKAAAASSSGGESVHCVALKWGFVGQSVLVGNALVHFYADHGSLVHAQRVFDEMSERDVVSWTTMVDGYARRGLADDAWRVFCRMVVAGGQQPNEEHTMEIRPMVALRAALVGGVAAFAKIAGAMKAAGGVKVGAAAAAMTAAATAAVSGKDAGNDNQKPGAK